MTLYKFCKRKRQFHPPSWQSSLGNASDTTLYTDRTESFCLYLLFSYRNNKIYYHHHLYLGVLPHPPSLPLGHRVHRALLFVRNRLAPQKNVLKLFVLSFSKIFFNYLLLFFF